jgi:hypothetical protein
VLNISGWTQDDLLWSGGSAVLGRPRIAGSMATAAVYLSAQAISALRSCPRRDATTGQPGTACPPHPLCPQLTSPSGSILLGREGSVVCTEGISAILRNSN